MTPSSANRRVGILLVLLAGIFWSTSGILYRLIQEATPWQVLLYRSLALLAALSLWLGWRYRGQVRDTLGKAGLPALAGGLCLGTAFSGYILALEYTTVANAMFLLASAPFFAALAGWMILGERIALYMWVAMTFAAVGIGIMAGEELSLGKGLGEGFAFGGSTGFCGTHHIASDAARDGQTHYHFFRDRNCIALRSRRNWFFRLGVLYPMAGSHKLPGHGMVSDRPGICTLHCWSEALAGR